MTRNDFNYDLFSENGVYLGTAFNSPKIVVGEPLCIPKGLLEKRNVKTSCLCNVVKIEPDPKKKEAYRVYIRPIENWQFGMGSEHPFGEWKMDRTGEDGWLRR